MQLPPISPARELAPTSTRLFIGAYGSEDRSLSWLRCQRNQGPILDRALMLHYVHTKGHRNRIAETRRFLGLLGVAVPTDLHYDTEAQADIESTIAGRLSGALLGHDEVVLDITAMTKLLILVCLCQLRRFTGALRVVYTEAEDYVPTQRQYEESKSKLEMIAPYPSRGVQALIRARCLSSTRMQGQPATLVAFTSFNEQLVRHMLGTISPHRLALINGRPPREDYAWRERATQEIHRKLVLQYAADNPVDQQGRLLRVASTFDYRETVERIEGIYTDYGTRERIICAATGSKMQTVGLFFAKVLHPDIHIEYPTPDSYYVEGISRGARAVHEVVVPGFCRFVQRLGGHDGPRGGKAGSRA